MREFREIRKQFTGDTEAAQLYTGLARTLLGQVKNQMQLGGLLQLSRGVMLEDGTRIFVASAFGQDTVRIDTSGTTPRTRLVEEPHDMLLPDMTIVGELIDDATNNHYAVIWHGADDVTDLGWLPDGYWAGATDISDDGQTVVGYCKMVDGSFNITQKAFRWTRKDGMQDDVGFLFRTDDMIATSVNGDGTIVVGGSGYGSTAKAWYWTKVGGLVALPDLGLGAGAATVSPDGKYIAGWVGTLLTDNQNQAGALWTRGGDGTYVYSKIPDPGTTSTKATGTGFGTYALRDASIPTDVGNDGVVLGGTSHTPGQLILNARAYTEDGPGTSDAGVKIWSSNANYVDDSAMKGTVFLYNAVTGEYTLGGDGISAKRADDARVIAGNSVRATVIPDGIHNARRYLGDPPNLYVESWQDTLDSVTNGWYKTPTGQQVSLGDGTFTYDISDNGEVIVGCTLDPTALFDQPTAWDSGGSATSLALLPNTQRGFATAVIADETTGSGSV